MGEQTGNLAGRSPIDQLEDFNALAVTSASVSSFPFAPTQQPRLSLVLKLGASPAGDVYTVLKFKHPVLIGWFTGGVDAEEHRCLFEPPSQADKNPQGSGLGDWESFKQVTADGEILCLFVKTVEFCGFRSWDSFGCHIHVFVLGFALTVRLLAFIWKLIILRFTVRLAIFPFQFLDGNQPFFPSTFVIQLSAKLFCISCVYCINPHKVAVFPVLREKTYPRMKSYPRWKLFYAIFSSSRLSFSSRCELIPLVLGQRITFDNVFRQVVVAVCVEFLYLISSYLTLPFLILSWFSRRSIIVSAFQFIRVG
ncbi:hypothetical protein VNO77_17994 [Canavalia gladiata]|uniref:Uncharacterized protein n=1 Tax=Canavalia gladiata TaxID=3824 RepID=A0AAN9LJY3_CANGL